MQNLIKPFADDIRRHDRITEPASRARVSFIDAADVAEAADIVRTAPVTHGGKTYTLTGSDAISYADVASMLSAELGRPIRYAPVSLRAQRRALLAAGADRAYANVQLVINLTARIGLAKKATPELADLLGRPPTTMSEFIAAHREAWQKP